MATNRQKEGREGEERLNRRHRRTLRLAYRGAILAPYPLVQVRKRGESTDNVSRGDHSRVKRLLAIRSISLSRGSVATWQAGE